MQVTQSGGCDDPDRGPNRLRRAQSLTGKQSRAKKGESGIEGREQSAERKHTVESCKQVQNNSRAISQTTYGE